MAPITRSSLKPVSLTRSFAMPWQFDPNSIYPTSVGQGESYYNRAAVSVRTTIEDMAIFAYTADGRAYRNNLALITGQPSPPLNVRIDSISDSPDTSRSVGVACSPSSICNYAPGPEVAGTVSRTVNHGGGSDSVTARIVRPLNVVLSADDSELSAIQCLNGQSTG